jgi:hypothetical protein
MSHRKTARSRVAPWIASLAICAQVAPLAHADAPAQSDWIGPDGDASDWFDVDNWSHGVPGPETYATIDHDGVAVIYGDARAQTIGIGNVGNGRLRIRGGTTQVNWSMSLGSELNSRGVLNVDGGALNIMGNLHAGAANGEGAVRQSGGAIDVINLELGGNWVYSLVWPGINSPEDNGRGRYQMTGGTLHTNAATIGDSGIGTFRQDGGRVEVDRTLRIGGLIESYELVAEPVLTLPPALPPVRWANDAAAQAGGTPADSSSLIDLQVWHPPLVPSRGRYQMESGELIGGDLLVDNTGVYRQTGGLATVKFAATRMNGRLALRGGSFHAEHGLRNELTLNLGGGDATISVGAGILDLTTGATGGQNSHVTAGADSLTLINDLFNPAAAFASFASQGIVHVVGNDLNLATNKRIAGAGMINDYVDARGTIAAAANRGINLDGGLRLREGASIDLGVGGLATRGRATVIEGGSLAAIQVVVGGTLAAPWEHQFQHHGYAIPRDPGFSPEEGTMRQTGGAVDIASRLTIHNGVYRLASGTLNAERIDVGVNQFTPYSSGSYEARFVQTGGEVRTSSLTLSQSYFYFLLRSFDGSLPRDVQTDSIPRAAATTDLVVPQYGLGAVDSTYRLEGGQLIADSVYVAGGTNAATTSRFVQTGGSLAVKYGVHLYGPNTTFVSEGGVLRTRTLAVGADYLPDTNQYPDWVHSDSATLALRSADADITVAGHFILGGGAHLRAVPDATVRIVNPQPHDDEANLPLTYTSAFRNYSTNSDDLAGLKNLSLLFDGQAAAASTFEVAGVDLGDLALGFRHNFTLRSLIVGGAESAWLRLVDAADNQRDGFLSEALYVDTLVVAAGSTLDLGGLNVYYRNATIEGTVIAEAGASLRAIVPEPRAFSLLAAALAFASARRARVQR